MTDKQIIIDGVDVSGCKYYLFREQQPKGERCCGMGLVDCNGNDCLYKKYKRKEQECERLKAERDSWHYQWEKRYEIGECLSDKLDQLKAENEAWQKDLATMDAVKETVIAQYKALKQTLTEIKEIAEELKNFYEELGKCEDLTVVRLKQILQKISEVENET